MSGRQIAWRAARWLAATAFVALPVAAVAGAMDDAPFSLRFPAALSRFACYSDVAAVGGASAASKWSSSVNPASAAWLDIPSPLKFAPSAQYSAILFDNGTDFHVTGESLTWDAKQWGVFQPAMAQVFSNAARTHDGTKFRFRSDIEQLMWGKKVSNDWAFGAGFSFSKSHIGQSMEHAFDSDSDSECYGFRFGALHKVVDKLMAGVVIDYGFAPSRTELNMAPMGLETTKSKDTTHQFLFRPGLSYEYKKDSSVYFDYQFGSFFNDEGTLNVHRFFLGVDHQIFKWLFVRGGTTLDAQGHAAWTAGVGIYPTDCLSIDFGFQHDEFPELHPEFGGSNLLSLSLCYSF